MTCARGPHAGRTQGQRGMTLLEILMYAGLSMLVIGLAMGGLGMVQKGVTHNQEWARMNGDEEEALMVMARDMRNMGLKHLLYQPAPGVLAETLLTKASYAPLDSSSFRHREGALYDTLIFVQSRLDASGSPVGVDTVSYRVNPVTHTLMRATPSKGSVEVCRRVEALQFEYGISGQVKTMAAEPTMVPSHWTASNPAEISFSGGALVVSKSGPGAVSAWDKNASFSTSPRNRYAFGLRAVADDAFIAAADSVQLMICSPGGSIVASEPIKVSATAFDFNVEIAVPDCNGCHAGVRVIQKGSGKGKLSIASFAFSEFSQGDVTWSPNPTLAEKKGVRSVRVFLLLGSDKPLAGISDQTLSLADIKLAFHDNRGRSLLDQTIPVPNNGF